MMRDQAMNNKQSFVVGVSYNGPFVRNQTAPLSFNQTVRNIALIQSPMRYEEPDLSEEVTSKTVGQEMFINKM